MPRSRARARIALTSSWVKSLPHSPPNCHVPTPITETRRLVLPRRRYFISTYPSSPASGSVPVDGDAWTGGLRRVDDDATRYVGDRVVGRVRRSSYFCACRDHSVLASQPNRSCRDRLQPRSAKHAELAPDGRSRRRLGFRRTSRDAPGRQQLLQPLLRGNTRPLLFNLTPAGLAYDTYVSGPGDNGDP